MPLEAAYALDSGLHACINGTSLSGDNVHLVVHRSSRILKEMRQTCDTPAVQLRVAAGMIDVKPHKIEVDNAGLQCCSTSTPPRSTTLSVRSALIHKLKCAVQEVAGRDVVDVDMELLGTALQSVEFIKFTHLASDKLGIKLSASMVAEHKSIAAIAAAIQHAEGANRHDLSCNATQQAEGTNKQGSLESKSTDSQIAGADLEHTLATTFVSSAP